MNNPEKKPIIGILGGIGSGKSTVAAQFGKLGCKVINADEITHELLEKESVKEKITASFGRSVLDSEGKIDHKKLAETVFTDSSKLPTLNGIIHPLVLERAERLIEQYNLDRNASAIVLDIPLLVEVGWAKRCNKLVFVDCERQLRINRAKKTGVFDENQLKSRENFQISLDNKAGIADNIVNNNSDFSALVKQVADIFSCVVNNG